MDAMRETNLTDAAFVPRNRLWQKKLTGGYTYGASVGSQQVRKSSLKPSRSSISAALISKSKTSAFSTIRLGLADLGMTTSPCCRAQRIRICAGDLLFEWRGKFPRV